MSFSLMPTKAMLTVALDRADYLNKMLDLLFDGSTYVVVNKDPTKKLIRDLHDRLMRWKKNDLISVYTIL